MQDFFHQLLPSTVSPLRADCLFDVSRLAGKCEYDSKLSHFPPAGTDKHDQHVQGWQPQLMGSAKHISIWLGSTWMTYLSVKQIIKLFLQVSLRPPPPTKKKKYVPQKRDHLKRKQNHLPPLIFRGKMLLPWTDPGAATARCKVVDLGESTHVFPNRYRPGSSNQSGERQIIQQVFWFLLVVFWLFCGVS